MSSLLIKLASPYIKGLLIILSILVLFRGHNHPGGGFIAGILASAGIIFDAFAHRLSEPLERTIISPLKLIIAGLVAIFFSTMAGIFSGGGVLAGLWLNIEFLPTVKLGTPLLFDLGVYLTVTGALVLMVLKILEDIQWK